MQTMTYDETVEADVTQADVENPKRRTSTFFTRKKIDYFIKEITGFLLTHILPILFMT